MPRGGGSPATGAARRPRVSRSIASRTDVCHLSAMKLGLLVSVVLPAAAFAGEPPLPLVVDGTMVVADNVRVGGTSARGATVSIYSGGRCAGEALASAEVEAGGRFTVAAN